MNKQPRGRPRQRTAENLTAKPKYKPHALAYVNKYYANANTPHLQAKPRAQP